MTIYVSLENWFNERIVIINIFIIITGIQLVYINITHTHYKSILLAIALLSA